MSAMANTTPIVTTVTKPVTNPGREKIAKDTDATPRVNIQDFCEEYYKDILPIIMDKIHRDKRKEVHARSDFEEGSRERRIREGSHYSSARTLSARYHNQSERLKVRDRLRYNDQHVLDRLGHRRQSAFDRLRETYSPSKTKSRPDRTSSRDRSRGRRRPHMRDSSNGDRPQSRDCSRSVRKSYDNSHSSYGTRINHDIAITTETATAMGPRGSRKIFPSGSIIGTLGNAYMVSYVQFYPNRASRVLFDELPPESIDSYKDLKVAFLAYFIHQKMYVKDPVEIHNIKKKDGETIEDFMEWFKVETGT
nr:reverse transcriptase domain-containing protein [Tanacetum cinerariifolium]